MSEATKVKFLHTDDGRPIGLMLENGDIIKYPRMMLFTMIDGNLVYTPTRWQRFLNWIGYRYVKGANNG